jgi:hypothetical protein
LQSLPPPRFCSPLRLRLARLCLDDKGYACPEKMNALRELTLEEALLLEDVAHSRQREALVFTDEVRAAAQVATK